MSFQETPRKTELAVTFDNVDISEDINKNLISLQYVDAGDGECDDLQIELADPDSLWITNWLKKEMERGKNAKYTKIGATITAVNTDGWGTDKILDCGTFELDQVSTSGPPQAVTIAATSLENSAAVRLVRKTKSWNDVDLQTVAQEIAGGGGYSLLYLSSYNPQYHYLEQWDEADIALLQRLATQAGLALKTANGQIILFDKKEYEAKAAVLTLTRGDGSYTSYSLDSALATGSYSSCHVSYEDDDGNTYEATFTPETDFADGEVLEVSEQVSSNAEALTLAQKRLRAANKGEMTGSFTMIGNPDLQTGCNVELSGWGDFDGKWSIDRSTHKIGSSGYTTSIEISMVIEGY